MARTIRVAVVGAGSAAQVVHLPILKRLPDVEIAGLVDPQLSKARTIADRFQIRTVAESLEDLLGSTGADAVLVCSPTYAHESGVREALDAGCHVMCERPLAATSETTEELIEAARQAERQLMVAMNLRFRYDVRVIRHFVETGELGEVFYVRATWLNRRGRRPRRGWRLDPALAGGGAVMDLGAQALDLALWVLDFPAVDRVTARLHGEGPVEASAAVQLGLETGATVVVEVTWELVHERDRHVLYVLGTRGSARSTPFEIYRIGESGVAEVTPPLDRPPSELFTDAYRQEWAEFLRYVRGEKPLELPFEQTQLMRVVEACYTSAREAREVAM